MGLRLALSMAMMRLGRLLIWALAIFTGGLGARSEASAGPGVDPSCVDRLAKGRNRFGEPLPRAALEKISHDFQRLEKHLDQRRFALLIDYTRNSRDKRAFMIDFQTCEVLASEYVIHGGSVYHPAEHHFGEPAHDGMLRNCRNPDGSNHYMTRPGSYVTWGCHQSANAHFPALNQQCKGVKLWGVDRTNGDAFAAGVVLHEHVNIPNDASVKLPGQGCPAFPPGRLRSLLRYGLFRHALVTVWAPQCGGQRTSEGVAGSVFGGASSGASRAAPHLTIQ